MDAPFQISHVIMLRDQQGQLRQDLAALQGNLAFQQLNSVGREFTIEGSGLIIIGGTVQGTAHIYLVSPDNQDILLTTITDNWQQRYERAPAGTRIKIDGGGTAMNIWVGQSPLDTEGYLL